MFMRNRLARKMAAEMREATCAGTQTSKAPTLSGPSVTNHYSVLWANHDTSVHLTELRTQPFHYVTEFAEVSSIFFAENR